MAPRPLCSRPHRRFATPLGTHRVTRSVRLARWLRHARAEARFTVRALRVLRGPALGLVLSLALGTVVERFYGAPPGGVAPSWDAALFESYAMMLGEMTAQLPESRIGQLGLYLLPVLGVVFVANGVLRLGFEVFDKQTNKEAWMAILAGSARDHIVLCGLGNVGTRIMDELLSMGEQVFVVEKRPDCEAIPHANAVGVPVRIGDAREDDLLRSMNVAHARAVIIATGDDLANLEIAMDVREIRADVPIVMRLYDQRLAQKVKATMGIQVSLSTSQVAAPLFASAALDPRVIGTHRVGSRVLLVLEVDPGRAMAGRTVADAQTATSFRVLAVRHDGADWIIEPSPDEPISAGDRVQLLVPADRLAAARGLGT